MTETARYTSLRDYLRVLREQRLVILVITLVAGGVALSYSLTQSNSYQATASLSFQDVSQQLSLLGGSVSSTTPPAQTPPGRAQTINDPAVMVRVQRALRTKIPIGRLNSAISTAVDPASYLVHVTATWGSPTFAARLASEFAKQAVSYTNQQGRSQFAAALKSVQRRLNRLGNSLADQTERAGLSDELTRLQFLSSNAILAQVVNTAQAPGAPVSPSPKRNTEIGLVLGLALGILVGFLRDSLDRRLRSTRQIQSELNLPMLGYVRNDAMGEVARLGNGYDESRAPDLESFRILRQNLGFLALDSPLRSILVTSALPEEGKSTVASSLACAIASSGKRTLLLECDLRRPAFAERLGVSQAPGLTDYLVNQATPQEVVQTISLPPPASPNGGNGAEHGPQPVAGTQTLVCIAAGTTSPQPTELLGSQRFKSFLAEVVKVYDTVVIDTSPLLPVADTLELLPQVDGVLVCVRSAQTTRDQALAAKAALQHYPARPTGVVVTGLRRNDEDYEHYSYGYT